VACGASVADYVPERALAALYEDHRRLAERI
jgi:hypothetical protein